MAGVTPATAITPETRSPITFQQAEQAAFNVEGIPRYDHIFIVMLENKSTQAMLNSAFAPKINGYLHAGNFAASYYATGNPSEPNYTALGGADDFGITDDSQWNCDATGPNAVQDLPVPDKTQPGPRELALRRNVHAEQGTNHNIMGKPNLFTAITAAGMTWRTYNESMNPGQDIRTDSVADSAVSRAGQHYAPGTLNGNAAPIGTPGLLLPIPAGLYKTKHHPGMAYQNVRSAPEFKFSNRTLGGGQWDAVMMSSTAYAIPPGYDVDQFGTDLGSGNIGQSELRDPRPVRRHARHHRTAARSSSTTHVTASDCSSVSNNVPVATGGNIIARGDNYVDYLVKRIQASPVWTNRRRRSPSCSCSTKAAPRRRTSTRAADGRRARPRRHPLVQNPDGTGRPTRRIGNYTKRQPGSRQEHLRRAHQPGGRAEGHRRQRRVQPLLLRANASGHVPPRRSGAKTHVHEPREVHREVHRRRTS